MSTTHEGGRGYWSGKDEPREWAPCVACGRPVKRGGLTCLTAECEAAQAAEREAQRLRNLEAYAARIAAGYERSGRSIFDAE